MIFEKNAQAADQRRWVQGDIFGLDIPADPETLVAEGLDFLTRALQATGSLAADNRVTRIIDAQAFYGGGTGKKLLLKLDYAQPAPSLPQQYFIKFSRNFENELWDRARFMMISEAHFAVLSRDPAFPVAVPQCLFADVEAQSCTGLIINECITYGRNGVEPLYLKCRDYELPDPIAHYAAILKGLARLSGAHRAGRLSAEFDRRFPYDPKQSAAIFAIRTPVEKLVQRAERMFEFIARHPQLFPDNVRDPAFQAQFIADLLDVAAREGRVRELLYGNPDRIAIAHWNANIDNCWFWRDAHGELQCGFMDWANVGPICLAQSVSGALSGAEPWVWKDHLDPLLSVYIDELARCGGPRLDLDELRLHNLLIVAMSGVAYSMAAPLALERDIADLDAVQSHRDPCFLEHENARIQLHMMTKMLDVWESRRLGDVVRAL